MHCTILEGDPKNRRRSPRSGALTTIYTYTETPHNVNGEIAHCFPPSVSPSCAALDRCGAHALELQVAVVRAGMLRCRGAAPQPFFTASRQIVQAGACSLASGIGGRCERSSRSSGDSAIGSAYTFPQC